MGIFYSRMEQALQLHGHRPSTQKQYLRSARHFVAHFMRPPTQLGHDDIWEYLLYLESARKLQKATIKLHFAGIRFLYCNVLDRADEITGIPWPRVRSALPAILCGTQVEAILAAIRKIRDRAIIMTIYGAGLRVSEACRLRIDDIRSDRGLIRISDGKGGRDRDVPLSPRLLEELRAYWRFARPVGPFLFPGLRDHISANRVRSVLHRAAVDAGIKQRVTPHVLRHSFATHLLESGVDNRLIQEILGHASARTTARYARVSRRLLASVSNPLDLPADQRQHLLG